jgi:hypothetical protein
MRSCVEDQDPGKRAPGAGTAGLRALPAPDLPAEKPGSTATGCGHGGETPVHSYVAGASLQRPTLDRESPKTNYGSAVTNPRIRA